MSNRNFDHSAIIQRLQNKNYARNAYGNNYNGNHIIRNPQNSDGNASRFNTFVPGAQTEYYRGLLGGGETINIGGTFGIPPISVATAQPTPPSPLPPSAPTINSIDSGNILLIINFTAPTSDGGSAITDYHYTTDNGTNWKALNLSDLSVTSFIISEQSSSTGLTPNLLVNSTAYSVRIRAINANGSGVPSEPFDGTPSTTQPPSSDLIVASLSTSLDAYNSANTGDWVSITLSEWNNLKANITETVTAGATDLIMNMTTNLGSGLTNAAVSAIVTNTVEAPRSSEIPANSYIYGFSVKFGSNLGESFGVFANTSTTSNTGFNQLGNLIPSLINGTNYFVLKGLSSTNGGTAGLIGFFTGTKLDYPNSSFPGSAAYVRFIGDNNRANPLIRWSLLNDSSIPTSSTALTGSLNDYGTFCIQALTTTTKQWN